MRPALNPFNSSVVNIAKHAIMCMYVRAWQCSTLLHIDLTLQGDLRADFFGYKNDFAIQGCFFRASKLVLASFVLAVTPVVVVLALGL